MANPLKTLTLGSMLAVGGVKALLGGTFVVKKLFNLLIALSPNLDVLRRSKFVSSLVKIKELTQKTSGEKDLEKTEQNDPINIDQTLTVIQDKKEEVKEEEKIDKQKEKDEKWSKEKIKEKKESRDFKQWVLNKLEGNEFYNKRIKGTFEVAKNVTSRIRQSIGNVQGYLVKSLPTLALITALSGEFVGALLSTIGSIFSGVVDYIQGFFRKIASALNTKATRKIFKFLGVDLNNIIPDGISDIAVKDKPSTLTKKQKENILVLKDDEISEIPISVINKTIKKEKKNKEKSNKELDNKLKKIEDERNMLEKKFQNLEKKFDSIEFPALGLPDSREKLRPNMSANW